MRIDQGTIHAFDAGIPQIFALYTGKARVDHSGSGQDGTQAKRLLSMETPRRYCLAECQGHPSD